MQLCTFVIGFEIAESVINLTEKFLYLIQLKFIYDFFFPLRNVEENSKKKQQSEEDSKETLKTSEVCLN